MKHALWRSNFQINLVPKQVTRKNKSFAVFPLDSRLTWSSVWTFYSNNKELYRLCDCGLYRLCIIQTVDFRLSVSEWATTHFRILVQHTNIVRHKLITSFLLLLYFSRIKSPCLFRCRNKSLTSVRQCVIHRKADAYAGLRDVKRH